MRKKYLSALLFGALLFASAGTFTSCKDYDDDINNLQSQITANADAIKALQDKINSGKWITELTAIEGGFKVTFSDGQSFDIVNGAAGQDGTQITIGEDGYWYFDGVKSEYKAVSDSETAKTKSPYVNKEDGYWYFFNEEGTAVKSEYKAVGASYAVKVNGGYNIYLPDANGEMMDPIFVGGAAAAINSIRFDANVAADVKVDYVASTFTFAGKTQAVTNKSDWKGTKALPEDGSVIYTQGTPLKMRIDPVTVAAEEIPFTLINSVNETLPNITLKAKASDELIQTSGTRSAANNGLFTVAIDPVVMSADQSAAFDKALGKTTVYALNADNAARSAYEVEVGKGTAQSLTMLTIADDNIQVGGNGTATVDVNKEIRIKPTASAALYDMYIVVKSEYENVLKITYSDDKQAFTINKNADETTPAEFPMTIYTCDVNGQTTKTEVTIKLSQSISNPSIYELKEYNVSDANGFFTIPLDIMKKELSDKGLLDTWKIRVKDFNGNLSYKLYSDSDLKTEITNIPTGLFTYSTINSNGKNDTSIDAAAVKVGVDNTKQTLADNVVKLDQTYYLRIGFNADNTTDEVNYISVPVKFTAPAVSELFTPESALIDSETGALNTYFNNASTPANYALTKAFKYKNLAKLSTATIKFTDDKVGETGKKASELAKVDISSLSVDADGVLKNTISLVDDRTVTNAPTETGYGQVLPMVIEAVGYQTWAYQNADDKKYSFKVNMMSALYEGEVKPVSGTTITVSANAESAAIITSDMIKGYDYNNNEYEVIPNMVKVENNENVNAWTRDGVAKVTVAAHSDYKNLIKNVKINPATTVDKKTVNGNIELQTATLSNDTEVVINVSVTDVWGYTKVSPVKVLVKINK